MEPKLEWQQPPTVCTWEKQEARKTCWLCWLLLTKVVWLAWVFVLPLTYYCGSTTLPPSDFANLFKFVVLLGVLFPILFTLLSSMQLWPQLLRKSGAKYQLASTGVSSCDWQHSFSFEWKRIESYRFTNHPEIPGVRVTQIYIQPIGLGASQGEGVWRTLDFDPTITPEAEIESLLRHYLTPA